MVFSAGTKDKGAEGNGTAKQERRILGRFKVEIRKLGSEWYKGRDQKGGRRRRIEGKAQVPAGSAHAGKAQGLVATRGSPSSRRWLGVGVPWGRKGLWPLWNPDHG